MQVEVGGGIELLAGNDHADYGLAVAAENFHICVIERNLHALVLNLVIDDGGFVDVSASDCAVLCLYDEEVFKWLGAVYRSGEVGEVVAELHGFIMDAVYPTSQHGHFWRGIGAQCVTGIAEVLEGDDHVGLGGIDVLGDAGAEQQFAAVAIVHEQLDGAQRTIVLADDVGAGIPGQFIFAHSIAVFIGTINKTFVFPSVAPRVGDDPCAHLVFFNLANLAVFVKVKFYTVVVSANSNSVVEHVAPCLYIFHASYAGCLVSGGVGDGSPGSIGRYADARNAASVHGFVATMVIEPFF